jgi:hypothetical protein
MMCHHTSLLLELRETNDPKELYNLLVASEQQVIRLAAKS